MGVAAVKMRIMPKSPDSDLEIIQESAKEIIEKHSGKGPVFEKKPIAFGLNSLEFFFGWPEENELEDLEQELGSIENVNSVELIDIRRAIG